MSSKAARFSVIEEGRAVVIHPKRYTGALLAVAAVWNAAGVWWSRAADVAFTLTAAAAALVFAYLAARAFADVLVRFDDGKVIVRAKPLFALGRPDFELSMAHVEAFVAGTDDDDESEGHAVFVLLRGSGVKKRLPLPLAGLVLRSQGSRKPLTGSVSFEEASAVAEALNDALDLSRRSSTHYRVMAGAVPPSATPQEREAIDDDEPAEEREARRRARRG
ncbi:MAG: hypothetical protein JST00_01330 [Deltaproteobacteria bacterium]|nr:hypothetical protein [Deltaproteobacteria bacterium]